MYFIQCGFFNGFFDLSARQRLDNVFDVPQNVPQNFTAFSLLKGYSTRKQVYQRQDFKIRFSLAFNSRDIISVSKIFICSRVYT